MRIALAVGLLAAFLVPVGAGATTAVTGRHAEELVQFPSDDADLTGGAATDLDGRVLHPAGFGPFPAVVLLHGCGGLYTKSGGLSARSLAWALALRDRGYLVLLVDSFGPRGVAEQCTARERTVRASVERARDAAAALRYVRGRRDVAADRVALIGWSQGGAAVLSAYRTDGPGAGYRAAIAFYPGCRARLKEPDWRPAGPLLVLVGRNDDWTPAAPCEELATRDGVKELLTLVVYPDAHHSFDVPHLPLRELRGLPKQPGGVATIGTNEDARADALQRVSTFLADALKAGD